MPRRSRKRAESQTFPAFEVTNGEIKMVKLTAAQMAALKLAAASPPQSPPSPPPVVASPPTAAEATEATEAVEPDELDEDETNVPQEDGPNNTFPLYSFEEIMTAIREGDYYVFPAWVTPELAAKLLELNTDNYRSVVKFLVARYTGLMLRKKWVDRNGDTISFSVYGVLDNGQNRLHAIVKSGTSHGMLIAVGTSPAAADTKDSHGPRSMATVLQHHGFHNSNVLAAAAQLLWKFDNGRLFGSAGLNREDLLAFVRANPGLDDACSCTRVNDMQVLSPPALGALVWFLFHDRSLYKSKADEFFKFVYSGANMGPEHPVIKLRDALLKRRGRTDRDSQIESLAFWLKTWSRFVKNQPGKTLSWRKDGPSQEPFPTLE